MERSVFVVSCERIRKTKRYYVKFPVNDQLIQRIKSLPHETRKWNAGMICWEIEVESLYSLIKSFRKSTKIHFDFGNEDSRKIFIEQIKQLELAEIEKRKFIAELNVKKEHWVRFKTELENDYEKYSDRLHALLKEGIKLYPHQIVAAMFMNVTRNTLISHDMGLGKTLSAILYVEMNGFDKVVVITPNSLKFNFYGEVKKFTDSTAHIVNWKKNDCGIEDAKYIIINYDYFNPAVKSGRFQKKWKGLDIGKIDAVICDESQKLKNTKTNIYKNFDRTFKKNAFKADKVSKIFMSGTPAPNRAYELYTVLNQISPMEFPTKTYFQEYYCGMTYDADAGWGYHTNTAEQKFEELYHKIAPYTHRKRKADALKDLPDKTYQRIILEMTDDEQRIYEEIEAGVANEFVEHPNGNPLTIMIRLRQYLAQLKVKHVTELINNILETNEKVIVMDYFKNSLYELNKILGNISGLHTGDQNVEERAELVKRFQDIEDEISVFLGSIQTSNYGLTLTAASKLFIVTLPYSVGEYDQAADRCILKGELVLTREGYIPIENIKIGDLVYTYKGNWKKVINIKSKIERKKAFYDIKYKGYYKPLRCTEDHRIYVYNKIRKRYDWCEAKNLDINNHNIVLNKLTLKNNYTNDLKIDEYVAGKSVKDRIIRINREPILSNELLYAMGRFVGDGWTNKDDVCLCGHIKEYDVVKKCVLDIKKSFGVNSNSLYERCIDNKCEFAIYSQELTIAFSSWFGSGAHNKKIPNFIFNLTEIQIREFLNGYYDADGYKRKNTQQASTVSKYLSYQLTLLEALLGNTPTIRYNEVAKCWSFEYSLNDKISRNKLITNQNGNVLYPIEEIKIYHPKRNDERVYDIEVQDDHSFVVGLSTVHNCHRIGQKNAVNIYVLVFPDTIDDYVFSAIESKRKEIVKVIDNEDYESDVSESVLSEVIDRIKKKHRKNIEDNE
jgi:intein/homing endonuclease